MDNHDTYKPMIQKLEQTFRGRLRTVVLFGSRARGKTKGNKDHDIFLVIEGLPASPLKRQKEVRTVIRDIPLRINTISKTPEEDFQLKRWRSCVANAQLAVEKHGVLHWESKNIL